MFTNTYRIMVLKPRPSMNHDVYTVTGTYQQAVDEAHRLYRKTLRSTSVMIGVTCWHHINATEKSATDLNFNSGVVFTAQY